MILENNCEYYLEVTEMAMAARQERVLTYSGVLKSNNIHICSESQIAEKNHFKADILSRFIDDLPY